MLSSLPLWTSSVLSRREDIIQCSYTTVRSLRWRWLPEYQTALRRGCKEPEVGNAWLLKARRSLADLVDESMC